MKKFWILLSIIIPLLACEKEEEVSVEYLVSNNSSGFLVNYLNENGNLITEAVDNNSAQDRWSYSFKTDRGNIVFISAIYTEVNDGIKVTLIIDGKTFKQGSSSNDTINYVTVSGTVPYK